MLRFAWISNNKKAEIGAYEGLSKATYYLSEINRSNYKILHVLGSFYYKRHVLGTTEAVDSVLKLNTVKAYRNKSML